MRIDKPKRLIIKRKVITLLEKHEGDITDGYVFYYGYKDLANELTDLISESIEDAGRNIFGDTAPDKGAAAP
jgi:hypothetical protein